MNIEKKKKSFKNIIFSDPIAGPTISSRWIVLTCLSARSDALFLGEAALDNLVGRQALCLQRRDLSRGVLRGKKDRYA